MSYFYYNYGGDSQSDQSDQTVSRIVSLSVFGLCLLILILGGFIYCWVRLVKALTADEELRQIAVLRYSYANLTEATKGFRKQLRCGGSAYEGVLRDGTKVVVKKLDNRNCDDRKDLRDQVLIIGSAHHNNLVRLRGFCDERPDGYQTAHRFLVYEYMSGGSLDALLFSPCIGHARARDGPPLLSWTTRVAIALGIAKGVAYLHEECPHKIVHLDIKPSNILLDQHSTPKVADVGITKVMTTVQGTIGYLAPEWRILGSATTKMDVFSFGMVLLEIISGRRNVDHAFAGSNQFYFPSWAMHQVELGRDGDLVDARLLGQFDEAQAKLMLQIAFCCIHFNPQARPSMSMVVQMMEERVPVLPAPSHQLYPALVMRGLSSGTLA